MLNMRTLKVMSTCFKITNCTIKSRDFSLTVCSTKLQIVSHEGSRNFLFTVFDTTLRLKHYCIELQLLFLSFRPISPVKTFKVVMFDCACVNAPLPWNWD